MSNPKIRLMFFNRIFLVLLNFLSDFWLHKIYLCETLVNENTYDTYQGWRPKTKKKKKKKKKKHKLVSRHIFLTGHSSCHIGNLISIFWLPFTYFTRYSWKRVLRAVIESYFLAREAGFTGVPTHLKGNKWMLCYKH